MTAVMCGHCTQMQMVGTLVRTTSLRRSSRHISEHGGAALRRSSDSQVSSWSS